MSGERQVFVFLLILNLLVALGYLLVTRAHKKGLRRDCLMRFWTMLLCPVIGACLFFFSWLFFRVFFHREVNLEDVIFSKDRKKTYRRADEKTERNLVPLEEALAVTDRASTRVLMMDVIRRDISGTLKTIMLSLGSDDSEVAHYGASILQSALSDFRSQVQSLVSEIRKEEEALQNQEMSADGGGEGPARSDTETRRQTLVRSERELFSDLDLVLRQHVLSPQEQSDYTGMMDELAVRLKTQVPLTADELEMLCNRLLEDRKTARCQTWADLSKELYPEALSTYKNYLKLYYETGERDLFFRELEALKRSGTTVDHEILGVIRLFRDPEEAGKGQKEKTGGT